MSSGPSFWQWLGDRKSGIYDLSDAACEVRTSRSAGEWQYGVFLTSEGAARPGRAQRIFDRDIEMGVPLTAPNAQLLYWRRSSSLGRR